MKRIVLYDASAIVRPTREDLHQLARLRLAARHTGCDLVLTGVGQRLRLLLAVTGLEEVFRISDDEDVESACEAGDVGESEGPDDGEDSGDGEVSECADAAEPDG